MTEPAIIAPKPGELLPCPFCGSNAGFEHDAVAPGQWRVFCCDNKGETDCPMGYANTIDYPRRIEAAAGWNRREAFVSPRGR